MAGNHQVSSRVMFFTFWGDHLWQVAQKSPGIAMSMAGRKVYHVLAEPPAPERLPSNKGSGASSCIFFQIMSHKHASIFRVGFAHVERKYV